MFQVRRGTSDRLANHMLLVLISYGPLSKTHDMGSFVLTIQMPRPTSALEGYKHTWPFLPTSYEASIVACGHGS
jgi:hypothetical protein